MSEKNLKVGARVELTGKDLLGTVAYVGMTSFAVGKWVGVVLDEPKGKNSGSIKGQQYFQCEENCGMFVRPTQLRLLEPAPGSRRSIEDVSGATPTAAQPTKARLSSSRTSLSSSRQSLLGSRTQLTNSLSERTASSSSIGPRKSLAPQSSKDKESSSTSLAEGAPVSAVGGNGATLTGTLLLLVLLGELITGANSLRCYAKLTQILLIHEVLRFQLNPRRGLLRPRAFKSLRRPTLQGAHGVPESSTEAAGEGTMEPPLAIFILNNLILDGHWLLGGHNICKRILGLLSGFQLNF